MKVMVATDGKAHSDKAIQTGLSYSKAFGAKLYVLYVIEPRKENYKTRELKNGIKALEKAKNRGAEEGVEVVTMMEAGEPSKKILDLSNEIEADVLVVGTSYQKGFHLLSRTLPEIVIRESTCTVIVAK
ncbi:MAG: universal stress protein [Methanomassiliicoccales archaeon]